MTHLRPAAKLIGGALLLAQTACVSARPNPALAIHPVTTVVPFQPAKPVEIQKTTAETTPAATTPARQVGNVTLYQHNDLASALEPIAAEGHQLIALGEPHKAKEDPYSLTRLIAEQGFPVLAAHGYQTFISEYFPYGEDLSDPNHLSLPAQILVQNHPDREGLQAMIEQAIKYQIKLYGANITCYTEKENCSVYEKNVNFVLSHRINENAINLVQQLLSRDKNTKIVLEMGYRHNNTPPGLMNLSLYGVFPKLKEVDIIPFSFVQGISDLNLPEEWPSWTPPSGQATRAVFPFGREVIILP